MHTARTIAVVMVLCAAGCGPGEEVAQVGGTPSSPGTDGTVTVEPRPHWGNAYVRVELQHVTPPERLLPGATTYVVWDRRAGRAVPIGKLEFETGSREGSFEGSTTAGAFELVVTAERNASPPAPSEHVLLTRSLRGRAGG